MEQVSEVDLADAEDLRATLTGLPGGSSPGGVTSGDWGQTETPLLVHFGDSDFEGKYRTLLENIGQWRATAGRVESVDLRFSREAVVNPENASVGQQAPTHAPAQGAVTTPSRKPASKTAKKMALHRDKRHSAKKSV
jgi:hypothetical protein